MQMQTTVRTNLAEAALDYLDSIRQVDVFLAGDIIKDEYILVIPEGRTGHLVTFREVVRWVYPGGLDIFVMHLWGLCHRISRWQWERQPVVVKRRYIMEPFIRVFSVVECDETEAWTPHPILENGLVLVADYGHGAIEALQVKHIANSLNFLALTVQANSLNWGYNLLSKWPRADYVVVNEDEVRLTRAEKHGDLRLLIAAEQNRLGAKLFVTTRRDRGCILYDGERYLEMPALSKRPLDPLGAGDAFLAATAPMVYLGAPMEVVGLVGSVAAALECEQMGNVPITREQLKAGIEAYSRKGPVSD